MTMAIHVALVTGGYTEEAAVSLRSADFVERQLRTKYETLYRIVITPDSWYGVDAAGTQHPVNRADFTLSVDGTTIRFDVAFIILHGSPGEDGLLQGYLDMLGIPYTSCGVLTSALTMNKAYTKAALRGIADLYLAESVQLFASQREAAADMVAAQLRLPYFVKPNAGGSSIGMSKVSNLAELPGAIQRAFDTENTGSQVLVEEFVSGREFSVGVCRRRDGLFVFPITEVVTSREFFDYEAKYVPGLTEEITPAALTDDQRSRVERIVRAVYTRLDCKGMVRVDFFLERDTDHFYFIEINTIPGQTEQSFLPQQMRAAGMNESDFYAELIELAMQER